VVHKNSKRA